MLFYRLALAAMLVGAISGLFYTAVQHVQVIPMIQVAERYENAPVTGAASAAQVHEHKGDDHQAHSHDHGGGTWEPADGIERTTYTLLTNVLTSIALAMVLLALMAATRSGKALAALDWRHGLLWGAAGYLAFFVAPAISLPPEIPGSASAALEDRQVWWIATVVCSAAALAGAAFLKSPWRWAALLLLAVPHLIGAPHLDPGDPMFPTQGPAAAAELMQLTKQFVSATAIANAALWLALGLTSVWAVRRFVAPADINP